MYIALSCNPSETLLSLGASFLWLPTIFDCRNLSHVCRWHGDGGGADRLRPRVSPRIRFDVNNMTGYSGFYSFSHLYIALVAALMATSVTVNVFGKEKNPMLGIFIYKAHEAREPFGRSAWQPHSHFDISGGNPRLSILLLEVWTLDTNAILATLSIPLTQFVL